MVPVLLAVCVGPLLAWKRSDLLPAFQRLYAVGAASLLSVVVLLAFTTDAPVLASAAIGLAVWVMVGAWAELYYRSGISGNSGSVALQRLRGVPRAMWGTAFAHFGIGVMTLGIVGATAFSSENALELKPGERMVIGNYELVHSGVSRRAGSNFIEDVLRVKVEKSGNFVTEMGPSKRLYTTQGSTTTEAAIETFWFSQLYVSVGDTNESGQTVVRAWWKSMVVLVWLGPILMAFGGILSLSDRRLRFGAPNRPARIRDTANA